MLKWLCDVKNASLDVRSSDGYTLLVRAATHGHVRIYLVVFLYAMRSVAVICKDIFSFSRE